MKLFVNRLELFYFESTGSPLVLIFIHDTFCRFQFSREIKSSCSTEYLKTTALKKKCSYTCPGIFIIPIEGVTMCL